MVVSSRANFPAALNSSWNFSTSVSAQRLRRLFLSYSYEFMRRSLIFYRNEIQKMTGKVSPAKAACQVALGWSRGWRSGSAPALTHTRGLQVLELLLTAQPGSWHVPAPGDGGGRSSWTRCVLPGGRWTFCTSNSSRGGTGGTPARDRSRRPRAGLAEGQCPADSPVHVPPVPHRTPWSSLGSPRKPDSSWEHANQSPPAWAEPAPGLAGSATPPGKNRSSSPQR